MDMSYEEKLVRRVAKLLNSEVDVWTTVVGVKCIGIYLPGTSTWIFGPYIVETPFADVWKFAIDKIISSNYVCNRLGVQQPSCVEELEIRLAAAGV